MTDCTRLVGRAVVTTAALFEGLSAEERDELVARLAARGYKPELSATTRKAGVTGGPIIAATAYRDFNDLPPTFGGPELLKVLRRPCCGLPDRTWIDPDTGRVLEKAITSGRWREGHTVTVAYRFHSLPDAADSITAAEVRDSFKAALDCWMAVSGIRLALVDDLNAANIQIGDGREDGQHGTLAWMYLPVGVAGPETRSKGHFDKDEEWGLRKPGRPIGPRAIDFLNVLIHELGHAWGMDHEPGNGQEILNPMYWPADHLYSAGRHWVGPKDVRTMQAVYGPPRAVPVPPPPPPVDPAPAPAPNRGLLRVEGMYVGTATQLSSNVLKVDGVFSGTHRPL